MATRLSLYNDALLYVGERALNDLSEERESRRLLDQVWNNGGVDAVLEEGQWIFAMRTVSVDYDPAIEPPFGYKRAFEKPSDWIITSALCSDEYFDEPLTRYEDETGYWYADLDTIYVRYVSNDASYGGNLAAWPESFKEFAAAYFAAKIALKVTGSEAETDVIEEKRDKLLTKALNKTAMAGPTRFPAKGNWVRARHRYSSRNDGGNNGGSLIG